MVKGLSTNQVINVQATLTPIAAPLRNFGIPLFLDDTQGVLDPSERLRQYASIEEVISDWSTSSGAYAAALKFFSQSPRPNLCLIGLWAREATKGWLHGALLTPSQQALANFSAVTSGAMSTYIDGKPLTVSGLNFSSAVNINGVASTLQTALAILSANATVTWNSALGRFEVMSGTTGVASSVARFTAPTAFAAWTFAGQPSANDTITVNGTVVTFVASGATGSQVNIGADLATTLASLLAFLNASANANIVLSTYTVVGSVLYAVSKITGTGGNAYTAAKSGTNISVSGANFAGGSGTDCTAVFGLSAAAGAPASIAGIAAETPLAAATAMVDKSNDWYALEFASATQPSTAEHSAVAQFIEALSVDRIYMITSQDQNCLDPNNSTDIGSVVKDLNLARTMVQYSSTSVVAIASLFGKFATVNFNNDNTTITGMWKIEPGITGEVLTQTQAAALKAKNINVFVLYNNGKYIVQWGTMANGDFIDERIGIDWFKNYVATALWNRLYQSGKVPQTDKGQAILIGEAKKACEQSVRNGFVAEGVWNGPPLGPADNPVYNTGDALPLGWYVWSEPYANQAQADREARKSMPINVAAKLAGAVHTVDLVAQFNR